MNIEIANRLVNLRKEKGLSQEQLAEKIGVSRQAVSKWERSEASPDTDNLIMLARLYEVSLDELLRTEDEILFPEANEGEAAEEDSSGEGSSGEAVINAEPEEPEEENPAPQEKTRDKIRIGADGVHFMGKNGNALTFGKGGIHLSGDDPEIAEKDLLLQGKIRRGCTFAAVAGLVLCGALAFLFGLYRAGGLFLLSLAPVPFLMAFLGKERKAVRVLFVLGVIAFSILIEGMVSYRDSIQTFSRLCFLLIPMYYRFITFLMLRSERKRQGNPKPPPSAYPFCDFLTYHEKIIDLFIYAVVWVFAVLLIFVHSRRSAPYDLMFLCLIPVGQSLVRAIRERNPDRFSLEALLLFILLFIGGMSRWDIGDLMRYFPILFTVPLYHWLCRRFMKRFAVSEAEKSETETE